MLQCSNDAIDYHRVRRYGLFADMGNATKNLQRPALQAGSSYTDPLLKIVVDEKVVKARSEVLRQGSVPQFLHLLLDGHAYRYKILSDGRRQIMAIMVPGDLCDLEAVMRGRADYGIGLFTTCTMGKIPIEKVATSVEFDPEMMQVLWGQSLRDDAIAREWMVSLGKRTAVERLAHLFCELEMRLKAVGHYRENEIDFHITQNDLADIVGLSKVHVNRTLQELRRTELIELHGGQLRVRDGAALRSLAGFDPTYLEGSRFSTPM